MRRKSYLIIITGLFLFLLMQLFLPLGTEREIKESITRRLESVKELEVEVRAFPPWEVLFSRVDHLNLNAEGMVYDSLYIESLSAAYEDIIFREGKIDGFNSDLNIVLKEEALNNYVKVKYPGLENFVLKLNPDQVYLSGLVNFLEKKIEVQLTGNFVITEANRIAFIPEEFQIEEINISAGFLQSFIKDLGFSMDLSGLNFPLQVERIKVDKGKINLLGGLSVRKAGL